MIRFSIKNTLLTTSAICAIGMFANNARAEVIPDPSTIAPDVITLTPTTESEHSGNYIVLYDTEEGVDKYYDLTLNKTEYSFQTGETTLNYDVKVPYEDVTITAKYTDSDSPLSNLTNDVSGAVFALLNNSAISNSSTAGYSITNTAFIGNDASSSYNSIISNSGVIDSINNNVFINNTTNGSASTIYNTANSTINDISQNVFIHNSNKYGSTIYNYGLIKTINNSSFIGNIITDMYGAPSPCIQNYAVIEKIMNVNFIGNSGIYSGAIENSGTIEEISDSNFISNQAMNNTHGHGGAITSGVSMTIYDSNFINNKAAGLGGAIYNNVSLNYSSTSDSVINIVTRNKDVIFFGNTANGQPNDIYSQSASNKTAVVNFNASEGKSIVLYGGIDGSSDYVSTVNINKDENDKPTSGTVVFNNVIKNQVLNMYGGTLKLGAFDNVFKNVSMTVYGSLIDMLNGAAGRMQLNSFTVSGAIQMAIEVDLKKKVMDSIIADTVDISSGTLDITNFLLLNDATEDSASIAFIIADNTSGMENITYAATAESTSTIYDVEYDTESGQFTFVKQGGKKPEDNPVNIEAAVSNAATVAVTSALANQVMARDIKIVKGMNSGDAETLSAWVETFGSDDDVKLKHFSGEIDTKFYGVVGGVDSKKFTYENGTEAVYGVYGAYVNGTQKHPGEKVKQDGGYLGVSAAFRKDATFANFTLNGGHLENEATTVWGKDKFNTNVVSLSGKAGVDLNVGEDLTLTPALYVGYTGIDTESYTNKAGVKIDNKFTNVITLSPEAKLEKGFGDGLSGYGKLAYKFYSYDNNIKADGVLLPEMGVKPYVEYGVGMKKEWTDKDVSSYAEVTRHDGGREGWDVNLGLKLDF